jgi:hypothetical protein
MTNPYPTQWQYDTQRGCQKRCRNTARRIERREVAPGQVEVRHVWPVAGVSGLEEALTKAGHSFRTSVVGGGSTWVAVTPRLGGLRGTPGQYGYVAVVARAFGGSQRQALQNLADQLGVKYGARCGR